MSLKDLSGVDCGDNNSLGEHSSTVNRDASVSQLNPADRFATELMPQTFNMNALLTNMPEVETTNLIETREESNGSKEDLLCDKAERYSVEWDKLITVGDRWDSEDDSDIADEYTFTEGNVMLENKNALEIGKENLKKGNIPGAVLCFEAAAQQQPNSAEAWCLLGTTQTENELNLVAITALEKSLEINPAQLEPYLTLAAAYANEFMFKDGYQALVIWLKANPKYSDLCPQDIDVDDLDLDELKIYVSSLYLRAAQLNPTQIDVDLQNALGVLFNITREYDKAADCFKTALKVASDDAKLWNRLGATLANSSKSKEAVDAYQEALRLEPGFIRARYNVGITCLNLRAYKQAAEHFLTALNQQYKVKNMYRESVYDNITSPNIWMTLRMACFSMKEHDLVKLVDQRNLCKLNKFFEIDS